MLLHLIQLINLFSCDWSLFLQPILHPLAITYL